MPDSLQGLNLIHPSPSASDDFFPDISAQLDIWTNLSFVSDEPLAESHPEESDMIASPKDMPSPAGEQLIQAGTSLHNSTLPAMPSFDINNFIAGFGIDPFLAPLQPLTDSDVTSLSPTNTHVLPSSSLSPPADSPIHSKDSAANKRTRPKRAEDDPLTTPVSATEDKRRRNTAASARFRAKKKEREQAMERRSKELESRVSELERECEGLRRENGWLKGLVVGVTSGNSASIAPAPTTDTTGATLETVADSPEVGQKRKRGVGTD